MEMSAFGMPHTVLPALECKSSGPLVWDGAVLTFALSLVVCAIYYYAWIYLLPKLGNYQVKQEVVVLEDGSSSNKLIKTPNSELERWDDEHDAAGRVVVQNVEVNVKGEGRTEGQSV